MSKNWDDNLKDKHLQIASSNSKRIAILAGPGTGKTTYGLLRRIMRLLQKDRVSAENILFLTFARTAAEDFTKKLDSAEIEGYKTDVQEVTARFDIEKGMVYSKTLSLVIPQDLKDELSDNAVIQLKIYDKNDETKLQDIKLRVQKDSYNVEVVSINLPSNAEA